MHDVEACVAHGCLAEDVVEVRLKTAERVYRVNSADTRNWEMETEMRDVDPPVAGDDGRPITSTVDTIIWKSTSKEPSFNCFEEFKLRAKLPNEPGKILFYPLRICYQRSGFDLPWSLGE